MSATDQPIVHAQALVTARDAEQARPQRRDPGEGLGHADHAPRLEGADRRRAAGTCSTPGSSAPDMLSPAVNIPLRGNGDKAWFGWPTDPKIEELLDAWFKAPDAAAQKKLADDDPDRRPTRVRALRADRPVRRADRLPQEPQRHHHRPGRLPVERREEVTSAHRHPAAVSACSCG